MVKRFIVVLFILMGASKGVLCVAGTVDEGVPQAQRLTKKLQVLYQADTQLKNTWTYETLTLARATSIYLEEQTTTSCAPLGYLRILGRVVSQHYSPQLFYKVGRFVIPARYQENYEITVAYAFGAAHAYSVVTNPLKQTFGYACGFVGVYLMMNMIEDTADDFSQRELKGLAYFCCREAGWDLHQAYSPSILSFLQLLPAAIMHSLFPEDPPVTTDPDLLQEMNKRVKGMDDNVPVKGKDGLITHTVMPKCDNQTLREAAIARFESTVVPRLLNAHLQAQNESLNLLVLWGQYHFSCSCYWQERELLKWIKSLGINNFVFEAGKGRLATWMKYVEELKSLNRTTASLPLNGDILGTARLVHAQRLNFNIIAGDPMFDKVVPLWQVFEQEYYQYLLLLRSGKISRDKTVKIYGYPVDISRCPDFSGRDRLMASTLRGLNESLVGIYGGAHLGGINKYLRNQKDARLFFVNCYNTKSHPSAFDDGLFSRLFRYYHMQARTGLLDAIFGKGCGDKYRKAEEEIYFFTSSPEVIHSIVQDDILTDS